MFIFKKHDKLLLFETLKEKIESEIALIEENRRLLYLELKRHEFLDTENTVVCGSDVGYIQSNSSNSNLKRKLGQKKFLSEENEKKKKPVAVTDILFFLILKIREFSS